MVKDSLLFFFEFPDEVDAYLSRHPGSRDVLAQSIVVALNPSTRAHLERLGCEAEDTLAYLTPASRDRGWQLSADLTRWTREHFEFDGNVGIHSVYGENLVWYSRWLVKYLIWCVELLESAVSRHNPGVVTVCVREGQGVSGPFVGSGDGYFGAMAMKFAAARGLDLRPFPAPAGISLRSRAGRWVRRVITSVAANPLVGHVHRWQLGRLKGRSPVLFTSPNYRLNVLAGRLKREQGRVPVLLTDWGSKRTLGWPIVSPAIRPFDSEVRVSLLEPLAGEDRRRRRRLEGALEAFAQEVDRSPDVFSHLGMSFADIVARKVRGSIGPVILGLHRREAALRMVLSSLSPSLVMANGSRADDVITGELCREAGVPAMMITHGSHPPPSNEAERHELGEHGWRLINAPYTFTALQSPVAEEFRKVFPTDSVAVRTGPLIWATSGDKHRSAALRDRMLGDAGSSRVIVHAGTAKAARGMRFQVYETPDEYVQGIRDLVEAAEPLPGVRVIVKFRPSPELSVDDLKTLVDLTEKSMVSVEEPLIDVLGFADLLVSFSSTVIEEALQNRVPVLLYGGGGRYQHVKVCPIAAGDEPGPAAVYHVKEGEDLQYALGYILKMCGGEGLGDQAFAPYVYSPEEVTSVAEFLRSLGWKADVPAV